MRWRQIDKWHLRLGETEYRVSKGYSQGEVRYSAWSGSGIRPHKNGDDPCLGVTDTPQEAMQLCEQHMKGDAR